ncbi:DUF4328 domain-containing protein [Nocardioides sp. CCNWLW239]|uniref:DUF4328 domain-containing protein n=1 Tax=Nocardioides sp. CCNWLW239 TaxID=3128902 RepID=UPI0030181E67
MTSLDDAPPRSVRTPGSTRRLANAAILLACGWLVLDVVSLTLAFPLAEWYRTYASMPDERAAHALLDQPMTAWDNYYWVDPARFILMVATLVVVSRWIERSSQVIEPPYVSGLSWAAWVMPIVNFWRPFQLVRGLFTASTGRRSWILPAWWTVWIARFLLSTHIQIDVDLVYGSAGVERADKTLIFGHIGLVILTGAGLLLWIQIIRTISATQLPAKPDAA